MPNLLIKRASVLLAIVVVFAAGTSAVARAADTVEDYIREYPNQQQTRMMNNWLKTNKPGTFRFTGLVDPAETTVVTPQATVDYGYSLSLIHISEPTRPY